MKFQAVATPHLGPSRRDQTSESRASGPETGLSQTQVGPNPPDGDDVTAYDLLKHAIIHLECAISGLSEEPFAVPSSIRIYLSEVNASLQYLLRNAEESLNKLTIYGGGGETELSLEKRANS